MILPISDVSITSVPLPSVPLSPPDMFYNVLQVATAIIAARPNLPTADEREAIVDTAVDIVALASLVCDMGNPWAEDDDASE